MDGLLSCWAQLRGLWPGGPAATTQVVRRLSPTPASTREPVLRWLVPDTPEAETVGEDYGPTQKGKSVDRT